MYKVKKTGRHGSTYEGGRIKIEDSRLSYPVPKIKTTTKKK
jgi:hypothetical protein